MVGFLGEQVNIEGHIPLQTAFETESRTRTIDVQNLVIDCQSPYHLILERPSLNMLGVVILMPQLALKFLISETEVGTVHPDYKEARTYYNEWLRQ